MNSENPINSQRKGAVVVCGDQLGSQIIALLLRDSGYHARSLPTSALLNEPGVLEGYQLLLLTPTPELGAERRKSLLSFFEDIRRDAELTIMELVMASAEEGREEAEIGEGWHKVSWPCRFRELERRIEEALPTDVR